MRILSVKRNEKSWGYMVDIKFNWLERLFGAKNGEYEFRDSGRSYVFGGGTIYTNKKGEDTSNGSSIGEAIDKFRRQW